MALAFRQFFLLIIFRAGTEEKREQDENDHGHEKQFQQRKPRGGESCNRTPGLLNHNSCVAVGQLSGNCFFDGSLPLNRVTGPGTSGRQLEPESPAGEIMSPSLPV
jgi:hypothetical protein